MVKKTIKVSVCKLTENGSYNYPWVNTVDGIATFTSTFNTCYFEDKEYKKIKGGKNGGNYQGVFDHEIYRIWQHKT